MSYLRIPLKQIEENYHGSATLPEAGPVKASEKKPKMIDGELGRALKSAVGKKRHIVKGADGKLRMEKR